MKNHTGLSKYHLWIILIYLILCPLLFKILPGWLTYNFDLRSFWIVLEVTATILIILYCLNLIFKLLKLKKNQLTSTQILLTLVYAFAFAFPEEIIFRGIIQKVLEVNIPGVAIPVILSATIFGLAHLPNGAHGTHPSKWNWKFAGIAFTGGLLLGLIFSLTGSLLIPTILHGLILIFFKFYLSKA